jgi:hypothetical protein
MGRSLAVDRRRFLAIAAGSVLGSASGGGDTAAGASVAVGYDAPGRAIDPEFLGLSYESALVAAADYFIPDNQSLLGLIRALGARGVIRIGGNTSERTVWSSSEIELPGHFVITPARVDRVAAAMRTISWRLIYGLNLADNTPERAAEEAAYVAQTIGDQLLAFQIGNEPDGFGRWSGVRPASYDVTSFLTEWQKFHAAIRARVPNARFAGPDVAAETDWIAPFADMRPDGLALLTRHYYADGPATDPGVTLPKLLRSAGQIEPVLGKLETLSRIYRLPYRIAETNSVYAGGRAGVSDTLGAALWGAELMFQIAAAGSAGINFHGGDDKIYTPIARSTHGGYGAKPLYYAMLLFRKTARGVLVPARLETAAELAAFAVRDGDGTLRLCLINRDDRETPVRIDPGRPFEHASIIRLAAAGADARAGVTLGGAEVGAFGNWSPASRETARFEAGSLVVRVPGTSAALVTMDS